MSISASLNAVFVVDSTTYNASMNIPTSTPTADAPFLFSVTSTAAAPAGSTTPPTPQPLLTVAVGATSQVYVAVAPPMPLIEAVAGNVVNSLSVVVQEGTFDQQTNKFTA